MSDRESIFSQLVNFLPPKWFHQLETGNSPLNPILEAIADAIAKARISQLRALHSSIPFLASGKWLTLHLNGIGLRRDANMGDPEARLWYQQQFLPRTTRSAHLELLKQFTGLEPPQIRIEGDRSVGRFGQFRVVIESEQSWEILYSAQLATFFDNYVANGIIASLDVSLKCLRVTPFPVYENYYDFPASENQLGAIWERPVFFGITSSPYSRNTVFTATATEWFLNREKIMAVHQGLNRPGAFYFYLSDQGQCPNLLAEFDLQTTPGDLGLSTPIYVKDGYQHYYDFPIPTSNLDFEVKLPLLVIPAYVEALPLNVFPVPLNEFLPTTLKYSGDNATYLYPGVDFTRFKIVETLEVDTAEPLPLDNPVRLFGSGVWTLALGRGAPAWGLTPPPGTTLVSQFKELYPKSVWWTNSTGAARSIEPIIEEDSVHLGLEFLYEPADSESIKELELRKNSTPAHYRRFRVDVDPSVVTGFLFLVKGYTQLHPDTIAYRDRVLAAGGTISDEILLITDKHLTRPFQPLRDKVIQLLPCCGGNLQAGQIALFGVDAIAVNYSAGGYSQSVGFQGSAANARYLNSQVLASSLPPNDVSMHFYGSNLETGFTVNVAWAGAVDVIAQSVFQFIRDPSWLLKQVYWGSGTYNILYNPAINNLGSQSQVESFSSGLVSGLNSANRSFLAYNGITIGESDFVPVGPLPQAPIFFQAGSVHYQVGQPPSARLYSNMILKTALIGKYFSPSEMLVVESSIKDFNEAIGR